MTETLRPRQETPPASVPPPLPPSSIPVRISVVLACALLGFALVAQLRSTEELGERLEIEREEDLAQILADLSAQSDRLQTEITDLRLTLAAFESTAEREDLAVESLRKRLNEVRVLAGTARVRGPGVQLVVNDPTRQVTQVEMVDTVQELRDAGAEAIAVGGVRLVASSSFVTRNGRLVVDGTPIDPPYIIQAVGPSQTIAQALSIPGGAVDSLEALPRVGATVNTQDRMTIPARPEPVPFVFAEPDIPADSE